MIRFLSGKLKKHTKLAKIVKISIFVNRLVFPMNFNQFNRFSHPMTVILKNSVFPHTFAHSFPQGQGHYRVKVKVESRIGYLTNEIQSLSLFTNWFLLEDRNRHFELGI